MLLVPSVEVQTVSHRIAHGFGVRPTERSLERAPGVKLDIENERLAGLLRIEEAVTDAHFRAFQMEIVLAVLLVRRRKANGEVFVVISLGVAGEQSQARVGDEVEDCVLVRYVNAAKLTAWEEARLEFRLAVEGVGPEWRIVDDASHR